MTVSVRTPALRWRQKSAPAWGGGVQSHILSLTEFEAILGDMKSSLTESISNIKKIKKKNL